MTSIFAHPYNTLLSDNRALARVDLQTDLHPKKLRGLPKFAQVSPLKVGVSMPSLV